MLHPEEPTRPGFGPSPEPEDPTPPDGHISAAHIRRRLIRVEEKANSLQGDQDKRLVLITQFHDHIEEYRRTAAKFYATQWNPMMQRVAENRAAIWFAVGLAMSALFGGLWLLTLHFW